MLSCTICNIILDSKQNSICCNICEKSFHIECVHITKTLFSLLDKSKSEFFWFCSECKNIWKSRLSPRISKASETQTYEIQANAISLIPTNNSNSNLLKSPQVPSKNHSDISNPRSFPSFKNDALVSTSSIPRLIDIHTSPPPLSYYIQCPTRYLLMLDLLVPHNETTPRSSAQCSPLESTDNTYRCSENTLNKAPQKNSIIKTSTNADQSLSDIHEDAWVTVESKRKKRHEKSSFRFFY